MSARDESDSEVESDVANENVTKPEHARRAFTRPFVHLVKRRIAVPSKARHEKLKNAGRVHDLCFTKNHTSAEMERLVRTNFPSLVGQDLSRLQILKSYSSGRSMQEVFCGVPTGKLVANEFKGSTKKKVFMYLLRPGETSSNRRTTTTTTTTNSCCSVLTTTTAATISFSAGNTSTSSGSPPQPSTSATFSAPSTAASTSTGQSSHSSLLATSPATSTTVSSHPSMLATSSATSTTVSSHPSLLATSPGTSTTVSSHPSLVATSSATSTTVSSPPSLLTTSSAASTTVPSHSSFNTVSIMPTASSSPTIGPIAAGNTAPRDGPSTRRYLATLAGINNENDDDNLLHSPFDEIIEVTPTLGPSEVVEIDPVDRRDDHLSASREPPETVGDIVEDLNPLGTLDSRKGKVPLGKMDRFQEVIDCERKLLDGNVYKPMPVFLNLLFDEVCHQGRADEHVIVCVVIKEGDDLDPVRRMLSFLGNTPNIYFWTAKWGTKSARQVSDKFGSSSPQTEVFILAPTTSRPVLMERYSGDALKMVMQQDVLNAINHGHISLKGLKSERKECVFSKQKDSKFTRAKEDEDEDEEDTEVYFRVDIPDGSLGEELSKTLEDASPTSPRSSDKCFTTATTPVTLTFLTTTSTTLAPSVTTHTSSSTLPLHTEAGDYLPKQETKRKRRKDTRSRKDRRENKKKKDAE